MAYRRASLLALIIAFVTTLSSYATIFIVPDDAEMVKKSDAIVSGVILSAEAIDSDNGAETVYELAVDRVYKGPFRSRSVIRITSPGGATGKYFTIVDSAAHFTVGDDVLLFLTPYHGGWTPTDLTLGKFRFLQTSRGYGVLARDADDIVGWDRDGKVHHEKVRLESEFLQFIEQAVAGQAQPEQQQTYQVEASDVLAPATAQPRFSNPAVNATFGATTYSVSLYGCDGTRFPGRWTTAQALAGIPFYKNATQNASTLADGGVSIIQNALAAWTSDCPSAVTLNYAGTIAAAKDPSDNKNVVVFNDPSNAVPGSWTGSGTVAITFSQAGNVETFDGTNFANFTDCDIVFQDGFPGNHPAINTAMTHEVGHAIGLRHADRHFVTPCSVGSGCAISCSAETACDSNTEECSATAIMTATANASLNFTLQTYDQNGVRALYPGGSCVTITAPTGVVATAASSTSVTVSWNAATGAASYRIYRSSNGTTFTRVDTTTVTATNFTDTTASANTAYLYLVRAVDAGSNESGDSNKDLATTVVFTDDPVTALSTKVKAVHITQLRTAVNAVRTLAGLGAATFTDATLSSTIKPRTVHITELRTALDAARTALSLGAGSYTDATLTAGSTKIKAAHVTDLRTAVK